MLEPIVFTRSAGIEALFASGHQDVAGWPCRTDVEPSDATVRIADAG